MVASGVQVAGVSVGGMTAAAAEQVIAGLAAEHSRAPVEPYVDPSTHGLVPGLDGVRVDVLATLRNVLGARPRQKVPLSTVLLAPRLRLRDLPPAPIYHASLQRPWVALVINVAWGDQYLPGMLRTLTEMKTPVTFCLVGRWAETHPDEVRAMVQAGQSAGTPYTFCNHGYRDHGWALLSQAQATQSIEAADKAIAALTGSTPRYFSPHRGEFNPQVLAASRALGHELILWSVDTIDWQNPPASTVRMRVLNRVKGGDIVLMHPTAPTAEALASMIQGIRAKGLQLVTLDALLSPEGGAGQG